LSRIDQELDYEIPSRPLVCAWVALAAAMTAVGIWCYPLTAMVLFIGITLIWINFYTTVMHYALDAEEFTKWPVVGESFVTFQSHHFPRWINTIHRKPVLDLFGEMNFIAVINLVTGLVSGIVIFRFYREVFVAWETLMLVACYATLCHRWAHLPESRRPKIATLLQRAHLALNPKEHWRHHAQAAKPAGTFVENFDLSFGWSNALFNRVLRVLPSPRVWLAFIVVSSLAQVSAFAMLLHWLRS
jgi:hypothetical protein